MGREKKRAGEKKTRASAASVKIEVLLCTEWGYMGVRTFVCGQWHGMIQENEKPLAVGTAKRVRGGRNSREELLLLLLLT